MWLIQEIQMNIPVATEHDQIKRRHNLNLGCETSCVILAAYVVKQQANDIINDSNQRKKHCKRFDALDNSSHSN